MSTEEIRYCRSAQPVVEPSYHLHRLGADFAADRRRTRLQRLLSRSPQLVRYRRPLGYTRPKDIEEKDTQLWCSRHTDFLTEF